MLDWWERTPPANQKAGRHFTVTVSVNLLASLGRRQRSHCSPVNVKLANFKSTFRANSASPSYSHLIYLLNTLWLQSLPCSTEQSLLVICFQSENFVVLVL